MFDVGFWELILIFGVGLIILGPERMPRVASQVGRWIGRARRTANMLRRQLEQEIAVADAPPPRKPKPLEPVNRPPDKMKEGPVQGDVEQSIDLSAEVAESLAVMDGDELEAQGKDAKQKTNGPASGL
ncbi:MAG: Sec-independent protein translocase protein TatB [Candidatus Rariloculaceae bacterium]